MSNFDAVQKHTKSGLQPYFCDIEEAKQDCHDMRECLKHYGLLEANTYNLDQNPSLGQVQQTMMKIRERILQGKKQRPMVNYMVIFLFAGHGLLKDG